MPAISKAQQRLMAAAEHGANFPMARKVRQSMTLGQLHDFAVGSMKGKPAHVRAPRPTKVATPRTTPPTRVAVRAETASSSKVPHPHRNLGQYLHQKKGGR